jgi:hypothetical protein
MKNKKCHNIGTIRKSNGKIDISGESTNTNVIVFGLSRPGLEPTIYHTRGEHANHYATDAVGWQYKIGFYHA